MNENNLPFYAALEKHFEQIGHGQSNVKVQLYQGKVAYMINEDFSSVRHKEDGTQDALSKFLTQIKSAQDNKKSGSITLTLRMKNGETVESFHQINNKQEIT